MMMKRIGKWAWSLSRDERMAAAAFGRAKSERTPASLKVQRLYAAMIEKQKKLATREHRA